MKTLTELLTYRALHFKLANSTNDWLLERVLENDPEAADKMQIRNVCAKLSVQLADRLDSMCGLLDISKRKFIEAALIAALDEAERVIDEVGAFENVDRTAEEK